MMSCSENEVCIHATSNMKDDFLWNLNTVYIFFKTDNFTANLGGNMLEHVSEMELYIILSTLEKKLWWNQIVWITKY